MRRIIERVVTVVTTTMWKISWEADSSQPYNPVDTVSNELPGLTIYLRRYMTLKLIQR